MAARGDDATPVLSTSTPSSGSAAAAASSGIDRAAAATSSGDVHEVVEVIDGDTIKVRRAGELLTVRMIGLDTPETVHPSKPVECFGREASAKAKALLAGEEVRLESDPSQDMRDRYGRLLAYVFLRDGTLFNQLMIVEGYGHEYTYDLPYQ